MTRAALVLVASILLAFGAAELLVRSFSFRYLLGKITGRGELQLLVEQKGIYDRDLERVWQTELYLRGTSSEEVEDTIADKEKDALLHRLMAQAQLEAASAGERIDRLESDRQMDLIRWEFRDEKRRASSLGKSDASARGQETEIARSLRAGAWLEAGIAAQLPPNDSEVRRYFEEHPKRWQQPARWRASHLFLAAPEGTPAETIESKRSLVQVLAQRLANGESFPALVAEFSEDEATRRSGGDLGAFGEKRMLPEIIYAVRQLQPGKVSPPIQSRLGFHLLRLTEKLPAHSQSYEEARPQILAELQNQRRALAVAQVIDAFR